MRACVGQVQQLEGGVSYRRRNSREGLASVGRGWSRQHSAIQMNSTFVDTKDPYLTNLLPLMIRHVRGQNDVTIRYIRAKFQRRTSAYLSFFRLLQSTR